MLIPAVLVLASAAVGTGSPVTAAPCTPSGTTVTTEAELQTEITNGLAAGDWTICIDPGTYRLTSTLDWTSADSLTMIGTGAQPTDAVLSGDTDGDGTPDLQILQAQGTITVNNLTFERGNGFTTQDGVFGDGGAIDALTSAVVTDSIFRDNEALAGATNDGGGGIRVEDTLEITGSTFTGNRADAAGAASVDGPLTIDDSTFSGNEATDDGGAFFSDGETTIRNSIFTDNTAGEIGGAGEIQGEDVNTLTPITVEDSTFARNTSLNEGGALNVTGALSLTIRRSTFDDNEVAPGSATSENKGGAVFVARVSEVLIEDSTFEDNSTVSDGGAVSIDGTTDDDGDAPVTVRRTLFRGNSSQDTGGGLDIDDSSVLLIEDVIFDSNRVEDASVTGDGGGLRLSDVADGTVSRVLFVGNTAADEGASVSANDSDVVFRNVTSTNNTAATVGDFMDAEGSDGGYTLTLEHVTLDGDDIWINSDPGEEPAALVVTNSVVDGCQLAAASITASSASYDVGGNCGLTGADIIVGDDPQLLALADNGGQTVGAPGATALMQSRVPAPVSPLIDGAPVTLTEDQRRTGRPIGAASDIGAIEAPTPAPIIAADETVQEVLGQASVIDLAQLVTAPDTTPTTFEIVGVSPDVGTATLNGSTLSFSRPAGVEGNVAVVYRVTDDIGQTAEATVTFVPPSTPTVPTTVPPEPPTPVLPETGGTSPWLAVIAGLALALGWCCVRLSRRSVAS